MVVEAPSLWEVAIMSKRTLTLKLKIVWHMQYGRISFKQAPDKKFAPSKIIAPNTLNFSPFHYQTHS
jgi:hypothetical protein